METPRLILRDRIEEDLIPFSQLNGGEHVMKYFPKTLSEEETRALYERIQRHFKDNGFGLYAIETKKRNDDQRLSFFRRKWKISINFAHKRDFSIYNIVCA